MFQAIQITNQDGRYRAELTQLDESSLPDGEVTVAVAYSTMNYKDGLAMTGRSPIVRKFPLVPGIDFAGIVESSEDDRYKPGDRVLLNGWGVGESCWGGFSQKARVRADWLQPVPDAFSLRQTMELGTAGYTAMLCVQALEKHGVRPDQGEVIVTGASGGVGSVAVSLLAGRGFTVVASTGKLADADYLKELGAAEVIDRSLFSEPGKPLQKERWAGAVDAVGSHTLANVCATTKSEGVVAACGLAQGMDFPSSVAPFILRGVTLAGINSVYCPFEKRQNAWNALAEEWNPEAHRSVVKVVGLGECFAEAENILAGKIRGRVVIDVNQV
ncbi:MAG: alcohol dehydrogenase [Gammaproteobacteria bacterium]|nr:MAG: alcohol dehydrogenase [Pseudomonadota bacterium]PIE38784.1 MAG: alcohol dehydrogenase [Gammaproteobacteria bacterium]